MRRYLSQAGRLLEAFGAHAEAVTERIKTAEVSGRPVHDLPSAQTSKEGVPRARTLDRAGIGYRKQKNCFVRVEAVKRAQRLFDGQS